MEKEFVPYDRSLRLKALGFDEPCLLHVNHYGEMKETRSSLWMFNGYLAEGNDDEKITINYEFPNHPSNKEEYWQEINIPTFSQVFRWFREKYQIFHEVLTDCTTEPKFVYTYNTFYGNPKDLTEQEWGWENNIGQYSDIYRTYEEAELACLDKLIEIVENKSE